MLEELKAMIEKYKLVERSHEMFWEVFKDYKEEEKSEFEKYFGDDYDEAKLEVEFRNIAYELLDYPECDYESIVVRMRVIYKRHEVGGFTACYTMQGEYEDDYFVMY